MFFFYDEKRDTHCTMNSTVIKKIKAKVFLQICVDVSVSVSVSDSVSVIELNKLLCKYNLITDI